MPDFQPLKHIASSITLNTHQYEEFIRIGRVFNKAFNLLLKRWYVFSAEKGTGTICGKDFRAIDECLRHISRQNWMSGADNREIGLFASNELCRLLRERAQQGLELPNPQTAPLTKHCTEVLFYWGYDIKVREHTVALPVLGRARVGRYRYFSGSIRAIGVREHPLDGLQCVIYYRNNQVGEEAPRVATPTGGDMIPRSPLNKALRDGGVGFMM